jgi:hypothetical protein
VTNGSAAILARIARSSFALAVVPLCADSQADLKTVLSSLLSLVAPPAAPLPRSLAALCSASVEIGSERLLTA